MEEDNDNKHKTNRRLNAPLAVGGTAITLKSHPSGNKVMNLKNIKSSALISNGISNSVRVGDFIHSRGERITDWGTTWVVEKVTPKQVKVVCISLWWPVFENHPTFGRVANGESQNRVDWLNECERDMRGTLRATFWRETGKEVGWTGQHVTVLQGDNNFPEGEWL